MNFIQTAAIMNKDRAKALRNASLGNVKPANKELIKSHKVVEFE